MKFYIVRHGETYNNAENIHQDGNSELSERGLKQAEYLANRFEHLQIDTIIASPYVRTKKTAEVISEKWNIPLEFSDLFIEVKRPSVFHNKKADHPQVISIKEKIKENLHDPKWHYSDEENLQDTIERAKKAVELLQNRGEESILIVSHGTFIRTLLGVMVMGDKLTSEVMWRFRKAFKVENTGLSLCELVDGKWSIHSWNDCQHLEK